MTTDGNATSHYEYDANGNRLVGPGLTASPVYDNQDRLLSYGGCSYTYKADGSLQTKICPEGTTTYDYDAFGNLRGVTLANGTAITYIIDGQNRRVGKKVNGVLVESFLYQDQLRRVGWYDVTCPQKLDGFQLEKIASFCRSAILTELANSIGLRFPIEL